MGLRGYFLRITPIINRCNNKFERILRVAGILLTCTIVDAYELELQLDKKGAGSI